MKRLLIALVSAAVLLGGGLVVGADEGSQCSMELPDESRTCHVTCKTGWTAYCGRNIDGKRKSWEIWCHCKLEPHEVADPHQEHGDDNDEEGDDGHDDGEEGATAVTAARKGTTAMTTATKAATADGHDDGEEGGDGRDGGEEGDDGDNGHEGGEEGNDGHDNGEQADNDSAGD